MRSRILAGLMAALIGTWAGIETTQAQHGHGHGWQPHGGGCPTCDVSKITHIKNKLNGAKWHAARFLAVKGPYPTECRGPSYYPWRKLIGKAVNCVHKIKNGVHCARCMVATHGCKSAGCASSGGGCASGNCGGGGHFAGYPSHLPPHVAQQLMRPAPPIQPAGYSHVGR